MHFHIITLFPGAFSSYLGESIMKRAIAAKKIRVSFYNPRDFTRDAHRRVDRRPYGGGPGMVLEAESVLNAARRAIGKKNRKGVRILLCDAGGKAFDTAQAEMLVTARLRHIVIICGRYEGIDARVKSILGAEPVSIGPYTLTGGELPAMVIMDALTRRIPGVLGKDESVEERRVASHEVYTRPEVLHWKGKAYPVPAVLLSGHHRDIETWKKADRSRNLPLID